jgi:hypothetical protein
MALCRPRTGPPAVPWRIGDSPQNDVVPRSTTLDARLGVVWDVRNDGSRLVRAGIGTYTGRFPVALHSTGLLGTGLNTRVLTCADSVTPAPDYRRYAADASTIPTTCAGGSQADIPVSSVSLMDSMFGLPRSLKGSMGYEHRLGNAVVAAVGMLYARTTGYYFAADKNLGPERFRSAVEDRPVYAPLDGIRTTGGLAGRVIPGANRATRSFLDVLVFHDQAESRTLQATASLAAKLGPGLVAEVSYAFTRSRDNATYTCCEGGRGFAETPNDGDPNRLGGPGDERSGSWGPADFGRTHTFVLSGRGDLPFGLSSGGLLRLTSGRPWTATVNGDANGDGRINNDRAFIGSGLAFRDPVTDMALLEGYLSRFKCLRDQEGTIATRNHCRDGWTVNLDVRLQRSVAVGGRLRIEAVLDAFNVLNGIDRDWGRQVGVTGTGQNLLIVTGFDPLTGGYRYGVNPGFGQPQDLTPSRFDQFSVQLGVRLSRGEP